MLTVRDARPADAAAIRDVYVAVYGNDYAHPEFYDTVWISRFICDPDAFMLVAEDAGRILGCCAAMFAEGDEDDLLAMMGRFVVNPSEQGRGVGRKLSEARTSRLQARAHFAYGEVRTVAVSNQVLYSSTGYSAVGFDPLSLLMRRRESCAVFALLFGNAAELRKNNPRVIPEVARLANLVLPSMNLPADAVVVDAPESLPTDATGFTFEPLDEAVLPAALRVQSRREVFGRVTLASGFFQLERAQTRFMVAKREGRVVGLVGHSWPLVDGHLRILELVGEDERAVGSALKWVDALADQLDAVSIDVEVSAHAPRLQRTLCLLRYVPVAYFPAMVFEGVERLDVVRMKRLRVPYDLGACELVDGAKPVRAIVDEGFERNAAVGIALEATRELELFAGLDDGERAELARLGLLRTVEPGAVMLREGGPTDKLLVLVSGAAEVRSSSGRRAPLAEGNIFGEMALVESLPRSADVVATQRCTALELDVGALNRLMDARPRLGVTVARNLARGLADKLREP